MKFIMDIAGNTLYQHLKQIDVIFRSRDFDQEKSPRTYVYSVSHTHTHIYFFFKLVLTPCNNHETLKYVKNFENRTNPGKLIKLLFT